jgi:hypothetical protein
MVPGPTVSQELQISTLSPSSASATVKDESGSLAAKQVYTSTIIGR